MQFQFKTKGTCSQMIQFELKEDKVYNIVFHGGCNGNLKAIAKLVEGMTVSEIQNKLKGNMCGFRSTSCADQLAIAVKEALEQSK